MLAGGLGEVPALGRARREAGARAGAGRRRRGPVHDPECRTDGGNRRAVASMTKPASAAGGPASAEWVRRRERGSPLLLRLMAVFSLTVGRRAGRVVLHIVAAYFFLFA